MLPLWRQTIARWPADIRILLEERAAIIEYDGNLQRPEAELAAFHIVEAMWARRS